MTETLRVFAGARSDGSPVYEEVVVEPVGGRRYRLVQSPGLVLGIAADDVFELNEELRVNVISRGGNLCIQIYFTEESIGLEQMLAKMLSPLGGRLDGKSSRQLVWTVPMSVGFRTVEEALRAVVEKFPKAEWYYGNVYDPDDGVTPLNWW